MIVSGLRFASIGKKLVKLPEKGTGFYVAGKIKRYYLAFEDNRMYFAPEKTKAF